LESRQQPSREQHLQSMTFMYHDLSEFAKDTKVPSPEGISKGLSKIYKQGAAPSIYDICSTRYSLLWMKIIPQIIKNDNMVLYRTPCCP